MQIKTRPSPVKTNVIQSLTGLRFFAAFLVFFSHFYLFNYFTGLHDGPLYDLFDQSGWLGVSFFFVLSGFVLFINYCNPQGKKTSLQEFYLHRFARIYPVFFITTLIALPIELLSAERKAVWVDLLSNLLMVHCFYPQTCGTMNQPGWSIGTEFTFYLLFPLLSLLFIPRVTKRNLWFAFGGYFLYLGGMLFLFFGDFYARATFPLNRVGEFLLGMAAGWLYLLSENNMLLTRLVNVKRFSQGALAAAGVLFLLMLLQPLLVRESPVLQQTFYLVYALPAAGIILIFACLERLGRLPSIFVHPWLLLGGELSYSFYLIHHLVLRYTSHLFKFLFHRPLQQVSFQQTDGWIAGVISIVLLSLCLLLAYGLYQTVEKPMRRKIIAAQKPS